MRPTHKVATIVVTVILWTARQPATAFAQASAAMSQTERALAASKIFHHIETFFPDLRESEFDDAFAAYVAETLNGPNDRRTFDLASMALVASLHDSHSWFYDAWLDRTFGQPVGLTVYPWDGQWVVVRSRLESIKVGDVIAAIDGKRTDDYFASVRRYISASSDRDAAISLFDTPVLFPPRFTVTLDDGRRVIVDRALDKKQAERSAVEGRWLVPGAVGYVRMSAFHGIETVAAAWQYFNEFHGGSSVILDLRGNVGGGDPRGLQQGLMSRAYPMWSEVSAVQGGALLRGYGVSHPGATHTSVAEADVHPRGAAFEGRLFILIDRGCTCACEDFTMPFKVTGRAQLVGETTAGTFSFTSAIEFGGGMRLNMAAVRHTFPDGSRFEGVGIRPDVEVAATVQDLRAGRDVVLERALALAAR